MRKHKALISTLDRALSTRRPHGEPMTYQFTYWLKDNLPQRLQRTAFFDEQCNLHIDNRKTKKNRTLFVAHVDTVHHKQGVNNIEKSPTRWRAADKGQCLGADDGAGVALLMHMIHHDIPGYYIFTQGEECGGIGAKFLADSQRFLLSQFSRAIAFDRKDVCDIITHQAFARCCSDAFADALASALNATSPDQLMYMPSDGGIYTDTAEFTHVIPECTNISVGYDGAHGDKEWLDMDHYHHLSRAVIQIDWDGLPTTRDPSIDEPLYSRDDFATPSWVFGHQGKYTDPQPQTTKPYRLYKYKPAKTPRVLDTVRQQTPENQLYDAIEDARYGMYENLIGMMAQVVLPDEPSLAARHINKHSIGDEVLDYLESALDHGDSAEQLLEELFYEVQVQ